MVLKFRNIDADPSDPVATWPYEGIVTCLERGQLSDLARLAKEIYREPFGEVAESVREFLLYERPYGIAPFFEHVLAEARGGRVPGQRL